ncbi:hypothetical protein [Cryobacterium sp. SO1]|uniref:hypothetical protein n=1 Tax=Cryobacterium sp. SO1 TaxID=1897061 RepID=UPI0010239A25|nr:hypothetical protein [Cryobacterium sp. SO1]RZI34616.1 hypothetical protein BJQ95_03009 [Cryobacterium sp. SO1]
MPARRHEPRHPAPRRPAPRRAAPHRRAPNCRVWRQFADALSAPSATGDHFISSLPFSCVDGICPTFAGTLPTKYDTVHMTPAYAEHVAPAIRYALGALGLL